MKGRSKLHIHHLGMAVANIDAALARLRRIYDIESASAVVEDPEQDARLCYLHTANGFDIELISGRQVQGLLKKGVSYYHLCLECRDIRKETKRLQAEGALLVSPPKSAVLFRGRRVAFLYTPEGLVELLEAE